MNRRAEIGFSMCIRLDWLERATALLLAGAPRDRIHAALGDMLRGQLSVGSEARAGCRAKTITILQSIWVSPPKDLIPLRDDGLELLRLLPAIDHLPVHWGMASAVYPFFGTVAMTAGRLLRLQGTVITPQLHRRVREQLGERPTVLRATERVIQTLVDWDVLRKTETEKGVYWAAPLRDVKHTKLAAWLIEAALVSGRAESSALKLILQSPSLFPFVINPPGTGELESSGRLEFYRQGLDEDVVRLRSVGTRQLPLLF